MGAGAVRVDDPDMEPGLSDEIGRRVGMLESDRHGSGDQTGLQFTPPRPAQCGQVDDVRAINRVVISDRVSGQASVKL